MIRITISYRKFILCFVLVMAVCCAFFSVGCNNKTADTTKNNTSSENVKWKELKKTGEMELKYADMFSVDYYGDYSLVTIADKSHGCKNVCLVAVRLLLILDKSRTVMDLEY